MGIFTESTDMSCDIRVYMNENKLSFDSFKHSKFQDKLRHIYNIRKTIIHPPKILITIMQSKSKFDFLIVKIIISLILFL